MPSLATALCEFLSEYFEKRLLQDPLANVRLGLIGLPDSVLRDVFTLLTKTQTADVEIDLGGVKFRVPVLLLERDGDNPGAASKVLSRRCGWDYAVTVRNSSPLLLLLIPSSAGDAMPESLANAIEIIGQIETSRRRRIFRDLLWQRTIMRISQKIGADRAQVEAALQFGAEDSSDLPPERRNDVLWSAADSLLDSDASPLAAIDKLTFAVGLPFIGNSDANINDAAKALKRLSKVIGSEGLTSGIERLKSSPIATSLLLAGELDSFVDHIRKRGALAGATFERSPSIYFKAIAPDDTWWKALDVGTLRKLLEDLGGGAPAQLVLACSNSLKDGEGSITSPCVTLSTAELCVGSPESGVIPTVSFRRRLGRTSPVNLANISEAPMTCVDETPPVHEKPLKYEVIAAGYEPGSVDVIVLSSFECKGILRVRYADRQSIPTKDKKSGAWTQTVTLSRSGPTDVTVLHAPDVSNISIISSGTPTSSANRTVDLGTYKTQMVLDVENGDEYEIVLKGTSNNVDAKWTVSFVVDEEPRFVRSQFESLISAHQNRGKRFPPRAADSLIQKLEAQYLANSESWKPVLACWSGPVLTIADISWSEPRLGDTKPQVDPRVKLSPPQELLDSRNTVRQLLVSKLSPISEIDFSAEDLRSGAHAYIEEYGKWMKANDCATWFDCVAVHAGTFNKQMGIHIASPEPIAILMSPLHPLRVAWHAFAQTELLTGLANPCPAASLLDPSTCPDAGAWRLNLGPGQTLPRSFFALHSEHPHWSILWNRIYLGSQPHSLNVVARLAELGLRSHGLPGGFSRSQSYDSLQDVSKLVAARSVLRIGLIGEKDGSLPCALGIMDWCSEQYSEGVDRLCPDNIEIFDVRESSEPSAERIATLSNQTQERVKWFKPVTLSSAPPQDLVILDQLGVESPAGVVGTPRSTISSGVLSRIRIREDFNNAYWIRESRIARVPDSEGTGLPDILAKACVDFEETCLTDADVTQLQFQPNQQALGTQLQHAIYLAVTSRQIDPACIIRGARGQSVYLWNYELPATLGGEEENQGYYLIADPRPAMKGAIKESARLIVDPPPDPDLLLDEISRRGIPILKRLAAGGSQSRGELGLLLAVRLLQDAFRAVKPTGLPVVKGQCVHLIVPVDPYEKPFDRVKISLKATLSGQRPDLLVFGIRLPGTVKENLQIKITPVEVKYRQSEMTNTEIQEALKQATNFGELLEQLWVVKPPSNVWAISSRTLMGRCLDLACRIYADQKVHQQDPSDWTRIHETILNLVLAGAIDVTVNSKGTLLVFDNSKNSEVFEPDAGGKVCIVSPADAAVLLTGSGVLSHAAMNACASLELSVAGCIDGGSPENEPKNLQISVPEVAQPMEDENLPPVVSELGAAWTDSIAPIEGEQQPATVPPDIRERVNYAFAGFIGNEAAVLRVQNDLLRALIEKPPYLAKNYLFTGQPSTGKTELARRITSALQLPFVKLDGSGLRSRERLLLLIKAELKDHGMKPTDAGRRSGLPVREYPPMCVFVDEIHLVPRAVQESFLTVLESNDRTVTLEDEIAVMKKTTFLFATTRSSELDKAFLSRCTEIRLREYNLNEVAEIIRRQFAVNEWAEQVYQDLARFGRQVPRVALDLARELETAITVSVDPARGPGLHLDDVRRAHELDENGLNPDDISYLELLQTEGRMGEQAITKMLGTVDPDRVTDEIEPFLRRQGLIRFGPRGREITAAGREYILRRRRKK
jgi:DNA phosphorothioation-dependent restriction protein DptH